MVALAGTILKGEHQRSNPSKDFLHLAFGSVVEDLNVSANQRMWWPSWIASSCRIIRHTCTIKRGASKYCPNQICFYLALRICSGHVDHLGWWVGSVDTEILQNLPRKIFIKFGSIKEHTFNYKEKEF